MPLSDYSKVDSTNAQNIVKLSQCESTGIKLNKFQNAALVLPNSSECIACFAWMDDFFNIAGDSTPNNRGEIHLEPTPILDIWTEYKDMMVETGMAYVDLPRFSMIWKDCFPH